MIGYTPEHRAAVREAIVSGVKSVTYDGKTVTYHSMDDLRALLASIDAALSASTVNPVPTGHNPVYSKGV